MAHRSRPTRALAGALPAAMVFLAGCGPDGGVMAPTAEIPRIAMAAGRPAQDSVILAMTVADGTPYQIQSDGLGEYQNGAMGMRVTIDTYGNLQITPTNANGSTPPQRRLRVSYPAGQVDTYPQQWNFKIKTQNPLGSPRIQDLAVGASGCYYVTISHQNQTVSYRDDFNTAGYPGSSYALVARTSPSTWTVTSSGTASSGFNCGTNDTAYVTGTDLTVRKNGNFAVGLVSQPFSLALRTFP